jgi:hypothetical protein
MVPDRIKLENEFRAALGDVDKGEVEGPVVTTVVEVEVEVELVDATAVEVVIGRAL